MDGSERLHRRRGSAGRRDPVQTWRLIVRRTCLTDETQARLWPDWRHLAFATNRTVPTLIADLDHRDHAETELTIRDLKDQALRHFPSGQMHANSAWTVIAALAHNHRAMDHADRPPEPAGAERPHPPPPASSNPGRLIQTARRWTLRLPARWHWQTDFLTILHTLRALPART